MEPVDNRRVRAAVAAFQALPDATTLLDVLRQCLAGELLLDATGSDIRHDNGTIAEGSRLSIGGGQGPDGRPAIFAFTRQQEIARLHPAGTPVQSLAQSAAGVIETAHEQDAGWLYIDPAGPTCALSAADIDLALRVPRNHRLKEQIDALEDGRTTRAEVLAALREDGPLVLAATPGPDGAARVRTTELAGGGTALLAFTSAPELVARSHSDGMLPLTTVEVMEMLGSFEGLVVNGAGPSVAFTRAELLG